MDKMVKEDNSRVRDILKHCFSTNMGKTVSERGMQIYVQAELSFVSLDEIKKAISSLVKDGYIKEIGTSFYRVIHS